MRYSRGMPMGDYSHCAHCERAPRFQWCGFWLCDSCKERASISHYPDHGTEVTVISIDGERYVYRPCDSLNQRYEQCT